MMSSLTHMTHMTLLLLSLRLKQLDVAAVLVQVCVGGFVCVCACVFGCVAFEQPMKYCEGCVIFACEGVGCGCACV